MLNLKMRSYIFLRLSNSGWRLGVVLCAGESGDLIRFGEAFSRSIVIIPNIWILDASRLSHLKILRLEP